MKKKQKRGFLVALLVGFAEQEIHLWNVYTYKVNRIKQIKLSKKWQYADDKEKYHFFEELVDSIRPIINNGLKSILLANPSKLDYSNSFLEHINKHHHWLVSSRRNNQITIGQIDGFARNLEETTTLIAQDHSLKIISETISDETNLIINQLEKAINLDDKTILVLYGLKEIEDLIYKGGKNDKSPAEKVDYLLISDNFFENHKKKNRIYRLKQIAENKGIMTRIISEETAAGSRINEFGGIICFKKSY